MYLQKMYFLGVFRPFLQRSLPDELELVEKLLGLPKSEKPESSPVAASLYSVVVSVTTFPCKTKGYYDH